jgi:hypothetical protein
VIEAARAGGALAARFGAGEAEPPSGSAAPAWAEWLLARLPAVAAFAVLEHLFGVLPLIERHFAPSGALADLEEGRQLGALGLFTPTPAMGWEAAALAGEPCGAGGIRLRGRVRLPWGAVDAAIVLVSVAGGERRLAWVEWAAAGGAAGPAIPAGAARVDQRDGAVVAAPCWLTLDGAVVAAPRLSRPVTLAAGGGLVADLEAYAEVWALAAALAAGAGVGALRRAVRTTVERGSAWSASQLVALDLTALEIEAELTAAALRERLAPAAATAVEAESPPPGLLLAAAAARVLAAVGAKTAELRDLAGLAAGGPWAAAGATGALGAFLGGPLMLESEVGRRLGIADGAAAEGGA